MHRRLKSVDAAALLLGGCLIAVLLAIYVSLNTAGAWRFYEVASFLNYNDLADAIADGQLHLKHEVHPGRAAAMNPADPSLPYPRIDDAIIYKGKYYFLQEPLPGFIHVVYRLISRHALPTGVVIIGAAFAALFLLGVILSDLRHALFPDSPAWPLWYTWGAFALSGTQLYMVSRPVVYHESIVVGCSLAIGGAAVFFRLITRNRWDSWLLALSGALFGAAILCRLTLVVYPLCFGLYLLFDTVRNRYSNKAHLIGLVAFSLPPGFFIVCYLVYNYLRFGDLFLFGRNYVIIPDLLLYQYACVQDNFFRLAHIPYHLYHYLISLPHLSDRIPFLIHPEQGTIGSNVLVIRERVSSLAVMVPALLMALPLPSLWSRCRDDEKLSTILILCWGTSLISFVAFTTFVSAVARYLYEFTPLLFVVIFCNLAVFLNRIAGQPTLRTTVIVVVVIMFAANAAAGIVLGLNGVLQDTFPKVWY